MECQYKKLSSELSESRKEYKKLANKGVFNEKLYKKIIFLDKKLKDIDKSTGQWSTPGGNYSGVLRTCFKNIFKWHY